MGVTCQCREQGARLMDSRDDASDPEVIGGAADEIRSRTSVPAETSTARKGTSRSKLGNLGFDGRVFLTESEHQTYLRRRPVRYVRKVIPLSRTCSVCGEEDSVENPLQVAHVVPFGLGIVHFKLTPEWLDSPANLRWAHRRACNKKAELTLELISAHLAALGVHTEQIDAIQDELVDGSHDG